MKQKMIALMLVTLFTLSIIPMYGQGDNPVDMRMRILGEPSYSDDAIVAGVIHNVTLNLTTPSEDIDILMYASEADLLNNPNITNTYRWTYSAGMWSDALYGQFIESTSGIYGLQYSFHIGLNANATVGNWVMSVKVDGTEEINRTVSVSEPVKGLATIGPINFYVDLEPYRTGFWSSWDSEDPSNSTAIRFRNSGNVPLEIDVEYNIYDSYFTTTNSTGVLHVGEERWAYLSFQADPWSPGNFKVNGRIRGTPVNVMSSPATVSLEQAVGTDINVDLSIARPGYEIFQIPGFVVQYKARVTANYTDEVRLDMYFTGYNPSTVTPEAVDLTLQEMRIGGTVVTGPVSVTVNNQTETHMVLIVNCSVPPAKGKPSLRAYLNFDVENQATGDSGRFTTTFVVLAKEEATVQDDEFTIGPLNIYSLGFLVVIFAAIIFFLMLYNKKLFEERLIREEEKKKSGKQTANRRKKRK